MDLFLYFTQGHFRSRGASETEASEHEHPSGSNLALSTPVISQEILDRRVMQIHDQLVRAPRALPVHRQQHSRRVHQLDFAHNSPSQDVLVNQNSARNSHGRGQNVGSQQQQSLRPVMEEQTILPGQDNRCRSFSSSDAGSYQRLSLRDQIARAVLDFSCPYRNTRAQHRQRLIAKAVLDSLSPANPAGFISFATDDAAKPPKFDVVLEMSDLETKELQHFSWNADDSSPNIYVKANDLLTFHRNPVPQSTDSIRGKMGFSHGFHVWKITWPTEQRGTHPIIGVATKEAPLHSRGYCALVGSNEESFGWDILKKKCRHGNSKIKSWLYPDPAVIGATALLDIPDDVFCILDMDEGYLAFATDKKYLGIAFKGLKGKTLYPIVSAVWGHCEVTLQYYGSIKPTPRSLMEVCRRSIREQMRAEGMNELALPSKLQQYLYYM